MALTGSGHVPAPSVSYPDSRSFRAEHLGQSDSQSIYVYNSGDAPLTFSDITVTAGAGDNAAADFTLDTSHYNACTPSTSLSPYNNCYIYMTFAPTDTYTRTAHLRVTDNAGGSPHSVALSGVGAATSTIASSASLDFGRRPLGSTITRTVTLTNTSGAALTNFHISVYNNDYNHRNDISLAGTTCPNSYSGTLDVLAFNAWAIRLYEKVGFRHEGRLRDALWWDGAPHDLLLMAILATEWDGRPSATGRAPA